MTFLQSLMDSDQEEGNEERSGDEVCVRGWVTGWPIAYWLRHLICDHVVENAFVSKHMTAQAHPYSSCKWGPAWTWLGMDRTTGYASTHQRSRWGLGWAQVVLL